MIENQSQAKTIGELGEQWVADLYKKRGHKIIGRNYAIFWKKKVGEIDVIATVSKRLVMVEVKTRTSENFMPLEETVNYSKQSTLRRMAKLYVQNHPQYEDYDLQIDIAALLMDPVDKSVKSAKIIENAIEDV